MKIKKSRILTRSRLVIIVSGLSLITIFFFYIPRPLFKTTYSTVVESSDGRLLGARIADDQQWRFPELDSVPVKYEKCLLCFEDRWFYRHPGINPVSMIRALFKNIRAREIVSGGSTITMQVCRMARGNRPRSVMNKAIEMVWALNLELRFSKKRILNLYASHAPFGGNVVGIDAASWRYFQRPCNQLSWAEAAILVVLLNAPSLIFPGRFDEKLKQKRDKLLGKLLQTNEIDTITWKLALEEPLPERVNPLPENSYHLVQLASLQNKGKRIKSTIDYFLQQRVTELVKEHNRMLAANHIYNQAVVVSEVSTGKVIAYSGNFFDGTEVSHSNYVDLIQSKRSTGSILKPLLYCKMIDEGILTPQMLIPDIPTRFGGFTPLNFDQEYNGAVQAREALARSLYIPAVRMLQNFGVAPFYEFLKKTGFSTLTRPPDYYGLSLILGGAEVTLWDLAGAYTSLVNILNTYGENDGLYVSDPFKKLVWEESKMKKYLYRNKGIPVVRASSVFLTLQALLEVKRPESEAGWQEFASAGNIAWKTGTSFGFRDAWAVGMTSDYVVSVWVGNADGEGRPGLTGVSAAAPLMFDVFRLLPASPWFEMPVDEMEELKLCAQSGYRPGVNCDSVVSVSIPRGIKVEACPWHKKIHLDESELYRVTDACYSVSRMKHKNWFVLPPAMEYYFKQKNPTYSYLPPLQPGCSDDVENMEFIYPREWDNLFVPTDLDGTPGKLIFELVHRQKGGSVYWNLDDEFLGVTNNIHQMALNPEQGWHLINVTDNLGNQLTRRFFIAGKN